jgi:hypothetical protein
MKELISLKGNLSEIEKGLLPSKTLSPEEIGNHIAAVAGEYVRLGISLPLKNAWRFGKLKDSAGGFQDVDTLAEETEMSALLHHTLLLATFTADIGRLVVTIEHQNGNKKRTQVSHGAASVEVLERLGILSMYGGKGSPVALALSMHSEIKTPELSDLDNNKPAWFLCCLLRDLDMCSVISGKAQVYVEDQSEIKRQLVANNLEMKFTVDEEILAQFERGEPIDRLSCKTFPEWLLQFLAWRTNFTFTETWDIANAGGGYYFVLRWFKNNFLPDNKAQYDRILKAAENMYGLKYDL